MKDLINAAEYMIQLSTNKVDKEVRNGYYSDIEDIEDYLTAIETLYKSIVKGFMAGNYTIEVALSLFENEYDISNLAEYFGDKNGYINLLELLLKGKNDHDIFIDIIKPYIEVADVLHERIAISVYQVCLSRLVYSNMVLEDLELSNKIINYINNSPYKTLENKKLLDIIFYAMNNI